MISTTIFPGRYTQGAGTLATLGEEVARFGRKAFVICDPFVVDSLLPNFQAALQKAVQAQVVGLRVNVLMKRSSD